MSKKILIKIKGEELKENIPILVFSKLEAEPENKLPEKLLLEIKQIKKDNPNKLLEGRWFRVKDFDRVLYLILVAYFKYLLKKGYNIMYLVNRYSNMVRKTIKNAHKELKEE